jgi:hypothetical protein
MKPAGPLVKHNHKFAIFWGGGLGDILALRPLLIGLEAKLDTPPFFFTTATHMHGVFSELGLMTKPCILPPNLTGALGILRDTGVDFDWLYLGPHPRIKTRMLAHTARTHRIWSVQHAHTLPFIGEQVLADARVLGIEGPDAVHQPYGGRWAYPLRAVDLPSRDYLVLHPGSKSQWETTRWSDTCWTELLQRLLDVTSHDLVLVGLPSEGAWLERLHGQLGTAGDSRVHIKADLRLPQLARVLDGATGVVCHNSGVLHLSAMLGKPTVAVTGSSAEFWRPPYSHVINVTSGACNLACNQYRCPVPFYRARCIRKLDVETVMRAIMERLPALV